MAVWPALIRVLQFVALDLSVIALIVAGVLLVEYLKTEKRGER